MEVRKRVTRLNEGQNMLKSILPPTDDRERAINRSRRMWQTDMESNLNTSHEAGRIEGRAEGRAEGRQEGRTEGMRLGEEKGRRVGRREGRQEGMRLGEERGRRDIIQRMRAKGMDNAALANITGYPIEEVQQY
jgi:predicted transposase YdaD